MKILFICHANVCRSFMAQELLKQVLPQADVFSRGLYADPEFPVPGKVLKFLAANNLTPAPHRPTPLQASELQSADYVFCMEPQQRDFLADRYAQYSDKIWLVNEFAYGKETEVEDPISLHGSAFEKQARISRKYQKYGRNIHIKNLY